MAQGQDHGQDQWQDQVQDQVQDDDQEALRLMKAFYDVRDRESRRIIVAIVEAAARGASVKVEEPSELGMAILGCGSVSKGAPH
jgi:hypothetical protein